MARSFLRACCRLTGMLVLIVLLIGAAAPPARAAGRATLCVNKTGAGGCFTAIQAAITAAASGDTVLVSNGTYHEDIELKPNVDVISVNGPAVTTIDGTGNGRVVWVRNVAIGAETLLQGFTITGGNNTDPGIGGGIEIRNTSPTIDNVIIRHNSAATDGGGIGIWIMGANTARPTITNATIANNVAILGAGGLAVRGGTAADVDNVTFDNNSGAQAGGIRFLNDATGTVTNSSFTDNTTTGNGGGIQIFCTTNTTIEIRDSLFDGNSAVRSGAIDINGACRPTIDGNTLQNNRASGNGGAIFVALGATAIISNNTFDSNRTTTPLDGQGGAIAIDSSNPTIDGNTITDNVATCDGGGIMAQTGSAPTITNNVITGNQALSGVPCGLGGGVKFFNMSVGLLQNNVIQNNQARNSGGVHTEMNSAPTVDANLIAYNHARDGGGGIRVSNGSDTIVTNNFFIGNDGDSDGNGGDGDGVYVVVAAEGGFTATEPKIVNNTIVGIGETQDTCIFVLKADPGIVIANNIVTDCDRGIMWNFTNLPVVGIVNYNLYWNNGANYTNVPPGANDVLADPQFAKTLARALDTDHKIADTSPARGAAANTAAFVPTRDYFATVRQDPDIGAHEWKTGDPLNSLPTATTMGNMRMVKVSTGAIALTVWLLLCSTAALWYCAPGKRLPSPEK